MWRCCCKLWDNRGGHCSSKPRLLNPVSLYEVMIARIRALKVASRRCNWLKNKKGDNCFSVPTPKILSVGVTRELRTDSLKKSPKWILKVSVPPEPSSTCRVYKWERLLTK